MRVKNLSSFTRFAKAAEKCRYKNDFHFDLVQCDRAMTMGGDMKINAQCWLNIFEKLSDEDIQAYVRHDYRPGDLDPFRKPRKGK